MTIFDVSLILALFLCSLVAGFLFAFAVVAMPGIKSLEDAEYIRAFQAMDGVIQNNQPFFVVVWLGSIVAIIAAAVLGLFHLDAANKALLLAAAAAYMLAVQMPTFRINIPLNNQIQSVDTASLSEAATREARQVFEPRWNRWNNVRTVVACFVVASLIVVLYRM